MLFGLQAIQEIRSTLRVGGRIEKSACGMWEYQETLIRNVWDVSKLQGKEAQLYLIDEDAGMWAHLLVDHVVLYTPPTP